MKETVLFLTEDSKPQQGGIAEFLHGMALTLAQYYNVHILTSCVGSEPYSAGASLIYETIPWFRTQFKMPGDQWAFLRKFNTAWWLLQSEARAKQALLKIIKNKPVKMVMIFRLSPVTHPWCSACRSLKIPYLVMTYGLELVESTSMIKYRQRIQDLKKASKVFTISQATKAILLKYGVMDDRIILSPPGILADHFPDPTAQDRKKVRDFFGLKGRFILSLCYLTERKGIDLAIKAFASLARLFTDLDYVIAGQGPEYNSLRELVKSLGVESRVHFVGAVDDAMKCTLYSECEFFILPNKLLKNDIEGFGIVFLEAALYGKTSLAGKNGGVLDAIESERTGILVDTSQGHEPLESAMKLLLEDTGLLARLGKAARQRVLSRFQFQHTIQPVLNFLRT